MFPLCIQPWGYELQEHSPSPGIADTGHFDPVISKSEVSQWIIRCEEKRDSYSQHYLRPSWWWEVRREEGPRRCDPSAGVGRGRTTQMEESRLDLDFGPILSIVLDVGIFQTPVGNPAFFTTFPVSWEATGAHTTTVPGQGGAGWAAGLSCAARSWVPTDLGKNEQTSVNLPCGQFYPEKKTSPTLLEFRTTN